MSYKIFTAAILGVALLAGTAASAKTMRSSQSTQVSSHTFSDKTSTGRAIKVAHRTHRLHLTHLRHAHKLHTAHRAGHALVKANVIQRPVMQANAVAHREHHATARTAATPSVIR